MIKLINYEKDERKIMVDFVIFQTLNLFGKYHKFNRNDMKIFFKNENSNWSQFWFKKEKESEKIVAWKTEACKIFLAYYFAELYCL